MKVARTAPATTRISSSPMRKRRDGGPGTDETLRAPPSASAVRVNPALTSGKRGGGWCGSAAVGEQERAGERTATGAGDAHLGVARHLALAGLAPQLDAGLVQEAVAVEPTGRQLAAVGVERQHTAVAGDVRAALDEAARLPVPAEPHRLEPRHRDEREAVVHLREVHVGGGEVGAAPQLLAGVTARHGGEVVELVPTRTA